MMNPKASRARSALWAGMILVGFCSTAQALDPRAPENLLWTSVGAVGVVSGLSSDLVQMRSDGSISPTGVDQAGVVTVRYNVTAVPGFEHPSEVGLSSGWYGLRARILDESDASFSSCFLGTCTTIKNGIILKLQRMKLSTGAITTLIDLRTNSFPIATGLRSIRSPGKYCNDTRFEFDFVNYVYFIEATFQPTAGAKTLRLQALQIFDDRTCAPL